MYKGLRETRDARIIFLDMNSFFASVEQQYRPEFRNVPLAVVSHKTGNGTVLAACYKAKACGIKTGTKIVDALALCPHLVLTTTTPSLYREVHQKFMNILKDLTGTETQAYSIDEAAVFLSPNWYGGSSAHALAIEIKERFRKELGLYIRCSIGIAPNVLLAKVASNLQKPDGLTEITLEKLPTILASLQLTDLPGIAYRTALRLQEHQITTPLELYNTPALQLKKWFGIWGAYWWYRLHGYEIEGPKEPIKSMSHQHVLTHWLYDLEIVKPIVAKMSDRLIHRLRHNNFQCQTVWLHIGLKNAPSYYAETKFDSPSSSYFHLLKSIEELHGQFSGPLGGPIRKITLGFNRLNEQENALQLDLFQTNSKAEAISKAMEVVRNKYGISAIQLGVAMRVEKEVAREQLGFGRIKDVFG